MADHDPRIMVENGASRLAGDPSLLVETTFGPVVGSSDSRCRSWKGIRYAAPAVGSLRWRSPQPPQPWIEPFDALDYGPACPQPPTPVVDLPAATRFDEDCLNLNVWVSAECKPDQLAPVMVWIHGGAYIFGASSQTMFEAHSMLRDRPLVIVTLNYRLGALGFLDLSSFSSQQAQFDSNLALRDVLMALNWVKDNIAAFGGDPNEVTLAGESAGGAIVTTLLTVPAAKGLFARAIAESAPATSVYDSERAAKVATMYLNRVEMDPADAAQLRELPIDQVVEAGFYVYSQVPSQSPGTLAYAPIVDGDLLPDYPLNRFRSGDSHPVPLLIGTNKSEAAMFKMMKSPLMPITSTAIAQMFSDMAEDHPDLTLPSGAQIGSAYAGMSPKAKGLGVARDIGFRMPAIWIAEGHSVVAGVYLYRFDWATPMLRLLGLGATHATELPYLWGNLATGPKDVTFRLGGLTVGRRVSQRMQARWLAFVAGGQPEAGSDAATWLPYTTVEDHDLADSKARATLIIDLQDRIEFDLDRDLRVAWGDEVLSFL